MVASSLKGIYISQTIRVIRLGDTKLGTAPVDGRSLMIHQFVSVARHFNNVTLTTSAIGAMKASRESLEHTLEENKTVYGVNTGFGALGSRLISQTQAEELQKNLILSTSAGVGQFLPTEIVRGMMLLRANTLAYGVSGVRPQLVETLVEMINRRIHPLVPAKGSVGASGDLAPLSHMALCLIGKGQAEYRGQTLPGREALRKAGLRPMKLSYKEGLALNNGTQLMTAVAAFLTHDGFVLAKSAEIAAAMTLEALNASPEQFTDAIHRARPHRGQLTCASNIRRLLRGSKLLRKRHAMRKESMGQVQDPYSLRCIPQVLGATRDALDYARTVVEVEFNSATDNPLIFPEQERIVSGGNFHGQPISLVLDILAIALSYIANIAERRVARLLDETLNRGLPPFLSGVPPSKLGLHTGLMIPQYTAAALVSENKILASPASVDSIPTSANQEDFVSMGATAALKALEVLRNVQTVVAIELLTASQALDLRGAHRAGKASRTALAAIRRRVPMIREDRELTPAIMAITNELVASGNLLGEVQKVTGPLA